MVWLIPLLVAVGVVLILCGKGALENNKQMTWPETFLGPLCIFAGVAILIEAALLILEI